MLRRLLFLLVIAPYIAGANPTAVDFFNGSLATAKERAAQEGKLYFVDFVASWCMPCRWMDETTFSDPRVAEYMNTNYIPVKVDIDDFDGYAYKQQYNIRVLPSLLIFNSKGKLVARYQESLPPSKMLQILAEHNTSANRVITASAAPKPIIKPVPPRPAVSNKPPLIVKPTNKPSNYNTDIAPAKPTRATLPASPKPASTKPVASSPHAEGLYRFSVRHQASSGYSVQVGVYGEYSNLLREAAKIEQKFDDAILVHIAQLNGKTVYKILVGEFKTREDANQFRAFLQQKGLTGIIKDLTTING